MIATRIEEFGRRVVTVRRARTVATMTVVALVLTYGFGLVQRQGLVDGFDHVIGGDLLLQRVASQMTRDGLGDRLYDFEVVARYEQEAVAPQTLPGLTPNLSPPFVSLLYLPFISMRQEIAFALWTVLCLGLLAASLLWIGRDYPWVTRRLGTILLFSLSFFPVVEGLMAGSNHLVSLLLVTTVYMMLKRGHDGAAGVALGLQLYKPQLAVALFAVLLFKRRWKALAGFGSVAVMWALLSVMFVSSRSIVDYVHVIPALTRLTLADGFPFYLLSSIYAVFMIPLGPAMITLSVILGTLASLGILSVLARLWSGPWRTGSTDFDVRFAATLVATSLVSQYFLLHDVTVMILAAVLLANHVMQQQAGRSWGTLRFALATLWVVCFISPVVTQWIRFPLVPFASLFLGWFIWTTAREVGVTALGTPSHVKVSDAA